MTIGTTVLAVLGIAVLVVAASGRARLKGYQTAVDEYVQALFADPNVRPEVKARFVYGSPVFTLRFRTDDEKIRAVSAGLTRRFEENVQHLCGHLKSRGQDFSAERAVAVFSEEDERRWKAQAVAFRAKKK